ncbi:lytic transglycosylase [Alkalicoccus urumqiensis]|uniref:Lytic transglycosylase n=2 Tax=Alkalicoccus urumqiensis TaxID=1548213 RepID=A0A2P6MFT1_ALKUR|nr:lytic transglycosylase [Alkalicoccus urumqiensis]
MAVTALLFTAASLLLGSGYMETQQQISELETAESTDAQERVNEHMEELEEQISGLPDGYEVKGHADWEQAGMFAAHVYEDSEGAFEKDWGLLLALEAEKQNIDPFVVYELLRVETGDTFDPELVGPETQYGHAYGMAQFMENTGPWIAEMAGLPYEKELLFDPQYAIQLSVTYLSYLHDRYEGNWDEALTAYHRGMSGMKQYVQENGDAASWYAVEIQEKAEAMETALR